MFNFISIESSAVCNRRCVFCPNALHKRPDEYMPLDLMLKAAKELGTLKYNGAIATYLYNEPMRDKRLSSIARMYRAHVPRAHLTIATNGDYLKGPEDLEALVYMGFQQILINIYNATDGTARPEAGIQRARQRQATVDSWIAALGLNTVGSLYGPIARGRVVCRTEAKYGIAPGGRMGAFELQNRSGLLGDFLPATKSPLEKMCVRPWRTMNINWQGQGVLCCNDYHGSTNFGNLRTHTIMEMWESDVMNIYRRHLQDKDRNMPLCRTCDYSGGAYQHMIKRI